MRYTVPGLVGLFLGACASTVQPSAPDGASSGAADATADAPDDLPADAVDVAVDGSPPRVTLEPGTVAVGSAHACALDARGAVWCWGDNAFGQLGDGTTERRLTPVRVAGLDAAVAVYAGGVATCAVLRDRTARCWGMNPARDSETRPRPVDLFRATPQAVPGLADVTTLALMVHPRGGHACAIDRGQLWCWGALSQLPPHANGAVADAPVRVSVGDGIARYASNGGYHCVQFGDGRHGCWGGRQDEAGAFTVIAPFETLQGVPGVREIAVGGVHVCARGDADAVWCLGGNLLGALGEGSERRYASAGVRVPLLDRVVALAAGAHCTVELESDGSAYFWGGFITEPPPRSSGADRRPWPVPARGLVAVATGESSACARRGDGAVFCWGFNDHGQLGDGTLIDRVDPVRVAGLGP